MRMARSRDYPACPRRRWLGMVMLDSLSVLETAVLDKREFDIIRRLQSSVDQKEGGERGA